MAAHTAIKFTIDTAATMPIVGADLIHLARNIRPLPSLLIKLIICNWRLPKMVVFQIFGQDQLL